jgi:hypothetical protein
MKPARWLLFADGLLPLPTPFALSLSMGQAELVEAFVPHAKGFDRLSPNGSLRTLKFAYAQHPRPAPPSGQARSTQEAGFGPSAVEPLR